MAEVCLHRRDDRVLAGADLEGDLGPSASDRVVA
jgi:hypothetical protein